MKPKRKRLDKISPIERAVIAEKWRQGTVTAQIHALIGMNSDELVNQAGRVLYVVLGAALAQDLDADMPEMRIIRGAVGAIYDQAGLDAIPEDRRTSIIRGLEVAADLIPMMERKALTDSACVLALKLRCGHVMSADFERLTA